MGIRTMQFRLPENSAFQFYRKVIEIYTAIKEIKRLSHTEMGVMIYFCLYGISKETEDKLIDEKIVTSVQQYRNIRNQLINWGLILKGSKNRTYKVLDQLIYPEEKMGFIIEVSSKPVVAVEGKEG